MQFITNLDILGKQYQFNIHGGTFRTLVGGILTILLWVGTIVLTWYFGQDIYLKQQPNLLERNRYLE